MTEHEHRFWKRYRRGRRWRNQYGLGQRVVPDGAECACGDRISQAACDEWRHGVETGAIRVSFARWATS